MDIADERDAIEQLKTYYRQRAAEYEIVYAPTSGERPRPEDELAGVVAETLRDRRVLEVACGTGYWTAHAARVARQVVALDSAPEMLAIARAKGLPSEKVAFRLGDAYDLADVPGTFDAALAVFWFSHVPKARIAPFLRGLHARLAPDSVVLLADAVYVPEDEGAMLAHPGSDDTFAMRRLADGSVHAVLKNYYDAGELRRRVAPFARNLDVQVGATVWWVRYEPKPD